MLTHILENSRLAKAIEQVEQGEAVDWKKVAELQALDAARFVELYALETLKSDRDADDKFEQQLRELGGN